MKLSIPLSAAACLLAACAANPPATPGSVASAGKPGVAHGPATGTVSVVDQATVYGLHLGETADAVLPRIRPAGGAILMLWRNDDGRQRRVSSTFEIDRNPDAIAAWNAVWQTKTMDPPGAISLIMHRDPMAYQVQMSVCNGRIWKLELAYDPGAAIDAMETWFAEHPSDRFPFPDSVQTEIVGERRSSDVRHYDRVRRYSDPQHPQASVSDVARMFESSSDPSRNRSQAYGLTVVDAGICAAS
jgi:hypothetical protein